MTKSSSKQKSPLSRLLDFAGAYRSLTFVGLFLSAVAQICGMVPYLCVYLVLKDLIFAAPNFSEASSVSRYGWIAFAFASFEFASAISFFTSFFILLKFFISAASFGYPV